MTDSSKKRNKRTHFLSVILALLAGTFFLFKSTLPERWIQQILLHEINQSGWDAKIESVKLYPWFIICLNGVTLIQKGTSLHFHTIETEFGIWNYFTKKSPVLVRRLEVEGAEIELSRQSQETEQKSINSKKRNLPFDITKLFPEDIVLSHANIRWSDEKGNALQVHNLFLSASERENGLLQAQKILFNTENHHQTYTGLRAVTAWRNQVFYLADIRPDGHDRNVIIDDWSIRLGRILEGYVGSELNARIDDGALRIELEANVNREPFYFNIACWITKMPMNGLSHWINSEEHEYPPEGTIREMRFNFRGSLSEWRKASASLRLDAQNFHWKERTFDALKLAAVLSNGWLEVYNLDLQQAGNSLQFRGETALPQKLSDWVQEQFSFDVNGKIRNIDTAFNLIVPDRQGIKGEAVVSGYATGRNGELSGKLSAQLKNLGFHGAQAEQGNLKLRFEGNEIRIDSLTLAQGNDHLEASGFFDVSGSQRYSAKVDLSISDLSGYPVFPGQPDSGVATIHWNGDGSKSGHTGGLQATIHQMRVQLTKNEKSVPIDVGIDASYSPESVVVRNLNIRHKDTLLELAGVADREQVKVDPIRIRHDKEEWGIGTFTFPFQWNKALAAKDWRQGVDPEKKFTIDLHSTALNLREIAKLSGQSLPVSGTVNMTLKAEGTPESPVAMLHIDGAGISYQKEGYNVPESALVLAMQLQDNNAKINSTLSFHKNQKITVNGYTPVSFGKWWTGEEFIIRNNPLDLSIEIPPTQLSALEAFLPKMYHLEGVLKGNAHLGNTMADPQITGTLKLENGALQVEEDMPGINRVNGEIRMDGRTIAVGPVHGEVASGPFDLSGHLTLAGAEDTQLDLSLKGERLLLMRNESLRLRANTDLRVQGTVGKSVVSGTLNLVDGRFYRDIAIDFFDIGKTAPLSSGGSGTAELPPLFDLSDTPFANWEWNIQVRNASPFQITGNIAKGEVTPYLTLQGDGKNPYFTGTLELQNAVATLPFSKLDIEKATIYFDALEPNNPVLDVWARSQVRDYYVNIAAYGRLSQRNILLSSDPPLAQEEIIRLLTLGLSPGDLQSSDLGRAALGRGGLLFLDSLLKKLGVDESDLLNRVSVNVLPPSYRSGGEIIEAGFALDKKISLEAERDDWGYYNGGLRYTWRFR